MLQLLRRPRLPPRGRGLAHKPSFSDAYARSLARPEEFWAEAAQEIEWFRPFDRALDQ